MCPHKEWFDSYKPCDTGTLLMADDSSAKAIGIGTVKVKIFGVVRTLANVRHVPRLRRSLISLGALDTLGCEYSAKSGSMEVRKGALNGEKVKNLYRLIGKTVVGGAISSKVFVRCERSCKSERVQQGEGDNRRQNLEKEEINFSCDESLNSTHVYSY